MASLTINSVSLNIPGAWHAGRSLARLLSSPPKRNHNQELPYVDGLVPFDQYHDQAVHDLSLNVQGFKNVSGTPYANHAEGLLTNALYLRDNVFSEKGLVPAVFSLGGALGDLEADVQVANDVVADVGGVLVITFDLIIPAGQFV